MTISFGPGLLGAPVLLRALIHQSTCRDCPKSLGGARGVVLQIAEKACFDPFRSSHYVRIRLRSVAQTPFRTVSEGEFSEVGMQAAAQPHLLATLWSA